MVLYRRRGEGESMMPLGGIVMLNLFQHPWRKGSVLHHGP
jgi:hypothetical protein